jgi:hypothetical protein
MVDFDAGFAPVANAPPKDSSSPATMTIRKSGNRSICVPPSGVAHDGLSDLGALSIAHAEKMDIAPESRQSLLQKKG